MSRERPLSPHLQIYRPQLTAVLSITHRGTGILLALGAPVLVYWLYAAASGPAQYAAVQAWFGGLLGRTLLFAWTLSLFYHLANGLRHLWWDIGRGFDIATVYRSGRIVVAVTAISVIGVWLIGYMLRGQG